MREPRTRHQGVLPHHPHPQPFIFYALAALLCARTRSEKLPSDFIEKLPASVIEIARDAFVFTPLHYPCIAKSIELNDARLRLAYDLDETGTIITFKEGTETIEGVARADKEKVAEVIIPEGVKLLAKNAFEGCKLLAAVTLPQTLVEIGNEAFKE